MPLARRGARGRPGRPAGGRRALQWREGVWAGRALRLAVGGGRAGRNRLWPGGAGAGSRHTGRGNAPSAKPASPSGEPGGSDAAPGKQMKISWWTALKILKGAHWGRQDYGKAASCSLQATGRSGFLYKNCELHRQTGNCSWSWGPD